MFNFQNVSSPLEKWFWPPRKSEKDTDEEDERESEDESESEDAVEKEEILLSVIDH